MCIHCITDQDMLRCLTRAAQSGNIPARRALGPLIERIVRNMEGPMQQLTADPPDGPPIVIVEAPDETPPENLTRSLAFTRLSLQIEATMQRCHNCGADHRTWQCPEIAAQLKRPEASWKDVALGRELCRMRWRDFRGFVALLLSVPTEHLAIYADSYVAFMRSYRPDSDVTTGHVLGTWMRLISDYGNDDGPAAPALRLAA